VQSENFQNEVVAVQQQDFYTQLINNFDGQALGQLVGDLWISRKINREAAFGGF